MSNATGAAACRVPMDFGPSTTVQHDLERELYRCGLGHVYDAILADAERFEERSHPLGEQNRALSEQCLKLIDALRNATGEIEALGGAGTVSDVTVYYSLIDNTNAVLGRPVGGDDILAGA